MPLGDAVTLAGVRDRGLDYGRVRVWGSVTFIIAAFGSGAALAEVAPATLGGNAVLLLVLAASAVLLAACLAVPQTDRPRAPIGHTTAVRAVQIGGK
jgi:PPP family 3-phenylpropionic acid transporter